MVTIYTVKKQAAFVIAAFVSVMLYMIGSMNYGLLGGVGFFAAGLLIVIPVGNILISNPFMSMIEGKGILVFKMDSTGIIQPFLIRVNQPYLQGKVNGKPVEDVFDRETVHQLAVPLISKKKAIVDDDMNVKMNLSKKDFNRSRFSLYNNTCLIWNDNIESLLTKDFISEKESNLFSRHMLLYLNRKTQELSGNLRDFGRYIVENLKSKSLFGGGNMIAMIVIVLFFVILAVLFGPALIDAFTTGSNAVGMATGSAGNAAGPIMGR